MKRLILYLLLLSAVLPVHADFLTDLLGGRYNARTLSAAEQDSLLDARCAKGEGPVMRYRLECENTERLFRHSSVADWYIVDTVRHTRKLLGAGLNLGKVRDAVISPNGRYVAFAKGNNLYLHKLDFGTEVAVTKDEDPDIINGTADWLYEEEFGTTALFAFSPDSKQIAFVRLDEHDVPEFTWQTYLGRDRDADAPDADEAPQYPETERLRYPKAGCRNAKARVCVYDIYYKSIQTMQTGEWDDGYFPRIRWNGTDLLIQHLNRDQNKMDILRANPKTTLCNTFYTEQEPHYYVDYSQFDQWLWLSDGRFLVLSEREAYRGVFLHAADGQPLRRLTPDDMDVTALYAVDEATGTFYYQAAPTPATRQLYATSLKQPAGKAAPTLLSEGEGTHSARFARDVRSFIECYQSFHTPNRYTLCELKGAKITKRTLLEDNADLRETWAANELPEPQLLQIPNRNGQSLEAMLMLPSAVDAEGKLTAREDGGPYPMVVMHYSGPASQRVLNRWRKRFEYALVAEGYAVLIVDPRGGDARGKQWRNETYMQLGQKEAEDLIAAADYIGRKPYIDAGRMAILGWSYGGYETLYTMSMPGHPFRAGIAIAPVTDWRLYDSAYTERYMRRPQVNEGGYDAAELTHMAKDLSGALLIVHGLADDNVHAQHTLRYIDALVQADKQFDMQLYPDDDHFLRRRANYLHLHRRLLRFLHNQLQ